MKIKYRGITVPYLHYDKKSNYSYYIYKDKEYDNLNDLFMDFIGVYLTYHFKINDKSYEVHNLSDVIDYLLKNKKTFNIPIEYKAEYSDQEYNYILELQKKLIGEKLKIENKQSFLENFTLKDLLNYKLYKFNKEIFSKYKGVTKPKKIYSNIFKHDYYVVAGLAYESIYRSLDEVYNISLYYQFGGTKGKNNRSHFHTHSFDDLINLVFQRSSDFKIHVNQQSYYSKQEIEFLEKLAEVLKKMKFKSIIKENNELDADEYIYLKDNRKFLSLISYNIRMYLEERKYQKAVLDSHKI